MLPRNKGKKDGQLLRRLNVFSPGNAIPPGLGRASEAVYEAAIDIRDEYSPFNYLGEPVVALPLTLVQELASVGRITAGKAIKKLRKVGLLEQVPSDAIPLQLMAGIPSGWRKGVSYYTIPSLEMMEEDTIRQIVTRVRNRSDV
jgi:hypothetical protein